MKYKVSICVAIYNVGKEFLVPCIDSLLNQTYTNLEIILVDDGSTDGSGAVVDSYTDPRIVKIHTENQGVTAARKTGWMNSTGDYCLFVDGDDMLVPDAVAFFMKKLKVKEYDIITGWFKMVYPDGRSEEVPFRLPIGEFTNSEYIDNHIRLNYGNWYFWGGIYKRSVITEKAFDIDRKFFRGQDNLTFLGIVNNVSSVLCADYVFYHYVQRITSTTHTRTVSFDYAREYNKEKLTVANDILRPLIYPHVLQKLTFIYLKKAYRDEPEKKRKEYEYMLQLKSAYKDKLTLRLKLEFIIMKSSVLSYLYRTVGWSLMSKIKNNIILRLK